MSVFYIGHPAETDMALFSGGELGPLARWRIERHLERCAECKQTVSEFFHLEGELAELAELPPLDWNALAESIERRVAAEAPRAEPTPGFFSQPLLWKAGLATACLLSAVAVVRQLPMLDRAGEPEQVAALEADAADRIEPAAAAELRRSLGEKAASAREQAPAEPLKQMAAAARPNREEPSLLADKPAPPPPPRSPAPVETAEAREFDRPRALAEGFRQARPSGRLRKAKRAVAPAAASSAAFSALTESKAEGRRDAALLGAVGFAALPLGEREVEIAADGLISVLSLDPDTGTITITDVYAP